ncbi:helix-turn-helix transcriptional regulator [Nocardia sp. NPDC004068]|uniref:helix-turn-helix transcriptional regulator n=1 Tax=Nocardia sp. NPDC004068 TaxID=3364303 RepID=UPI00369A216B
MTEGIDAAAVRRAELGGFLRTARTRLTPADVGLPVRPYRTRRTPGLRREEVAGLARVSVTWYTWLEQGRDVRASRGVIDALTRALRLDTEQARHLRHLAGFADPEAPQPIRRDLAELQQLVDAVPSYPAAIHRDNLDYVVWNRPYAAIRRDPGLLPAERRNLLWVVFTDPDLPAHPHWQDAAQDLLGFVRAALGQRPGDARLNQLVRELSEVSASFREAWSQHHVGEIRLPAISMSHPEVGEFHLKYTRLRCLDDPELVLVVQLPVTAADADKLARALDFR